jgi:lycopene cyclase domain-containing protein
VAIVDESRHERSPDKSRRSRDRDAHSTTFRDRSSLAINSTLATVERLQYLGVLGMCVLVTLPLEFLFEARVWRRPRRLMVALVPASALFVAWDLWASSTGVWSFSRRYTIGVTVPGGMAIEELLFFLVIPTCGLLTLEAVRNVRAGRTRWQRNRTQVVA